MPRYKLIIEYNGTPYSGWQKQDNFITVQGCIESAIEKFCGEAVTIVGAGRTDAGVHAIAQVAHVDLPKDMEPFKVMQGINFYLFNTINESGQAKNNNDNKIAILKADKVSEEFNARFSAKKRHYLYRTINRRARLGIEADRAWHVIENLDVGAMQKAANLLLGTHDFNSFRDTQCQSKSSIKTLEQLDVKRYGDEIRFFVSARSFLHHQVRIMIGTLSLIGKGKWQENDLIEALNALDRTKAGPTAPADGLYLVGVDY